MPARADRDLEVRVPLGPSALVAALLGAVLVATPAAARADDVDCSSVNASTTPRPSTDAVSAPLQQMGLPTTLADGSGVTVALVDSGAASFHGTAAAGLINGPARSADKPVGIAPRATATVVPVYAQDQNAPATPPTSDAVAGGLQSLIGGPASIVVVPLQVPDSPALKAAVAGLVAQGVVVVAPSGDRDTGQGSPSEAAPAWCRPPRGSLRPRSVPCWRCLSRSSRTTRPPSWCSD